MFNIDDVIVFQRENDVSIVFAGNNKNPGLMYGSDWKAKVQKTPEETRKFYNENKKRIKNAGVLCENGLTAYDFDLPFAFGLFYRELEDSIDTCIYETPSGGARLLYRTTETITAKKYEDTYRLEILQSHYAILWGEAENSLGKIKEYEHFNGSPTKIKTDNKIISKTEKYFDQMLKKRYKFLTFWCIKEHLVKHGKNPFLDHEQSKAINVFMLMNDCKAWDVHNFRKGIYDFKEGNPEQIVPIYRESITNGQIKSTRKYLDGGGLPFNCLKLKKVFKYEGPCEGCPRKKFKVEKRRGKKGSDEEEEKRDLKKESLALLGEKHVFATPDDVEILYLYQDGKYVLGETIIKGEVEAQHGDDSSSGLCGAVVGHFKRRSYVKRTEFNKFDRFMPVENGVLNLETFDLTPHTPDRIFTFKLETTYDPDKKAPKFMKFINEIITNKEDLQVIQEYAGYTLLPSFPHHNFLILVGSGRNGKGSLIRTLTGILGGDNVSQVPLEYLDGQHRFAVANLFGKLMNTCSEPATKTLRTEVLKQITGQDRLDGEIKNKQTPLRFTSFAKFVILANKLPPVEDTTLSFWDRLLLVELTQTFTDLQGNKIPDIELQWLNDPDERSGILNWMLEGLKRLQKQGGFTQTKEMKKKKLEYKQVSDSVGAFLSDETQIMYGSILMTTRKEIYEAYKIYAEELGVTIESNKKLFSRLRLLPNVVERDIKIAKKKERIWRGIGLVSPETREADIPTKEKVAPVAQVARLTDCLTPPYIPSSNSLLSEEEKVANTQLEKGATGATPATTKSDSILKGPKGLMNPPVDLSKNSVSIVSESKGSESSLQEKMDELLDFLRSVGKAIDGEPVDFSYIATELVKTGWKASEVKQVINVHERDGSVYQPRPGFYKITGGS